MEISTVGIVSLVAAGVLPAALTGRWLARRLGQPNIVGEVALCLLYGGLLVSHAHWGAPGAAGREALHQLGQFGLALFLVGVAHEIRLGATQPSARTVSLLSAGSALLPTACGALLAAWVLSTGDPSLWEAAPAASLALMLAVCLAVTAVPVLTGILRHRWLADVGAGRLAKASAVSLDAAVLLTIAVALGTGHRDGIGTAITVVVCGIPAVLLLRHLTHTAPATALAGRHGALTVAVVAVAAAGASQATARLGFADVLGAVLIGLALPTDGSAGPWTTAARFLERLGRMALPILFTVTGTTLAAGPDIFFPWQAMVLATALATLSKLAGTYVGARLGAESHESGLRLAVLVNTRGLTEIVILQVAYSAHFLTPSLYLALVVMALVTNALSGPVRWAVDRHGRATVPAARGYETASVSS